MGLLDIKITPILDSLQILKITDEEYFSPKYSDYISNSRLNLIYKRKGGSCFKFLKGFTDGAFNPSFILGSAIHEQCLQPEYFTLCPQLNKPGGKVGIMADIIYKYNDQLPTIERLKKAAVKADFYHGLANTKQLEAARDKMKDYLQNRAEFDKNYKDSKVVRYIDNKTLQTVSSCIESLSQNGTIQSLLHPESLLNPVISENEQAIILECEVEAPNLPSFNIRLKAKLDNYTIEDDSITVNDVKTTSAGVDYFKTAIEGYSYHREMAFYTTLLKLVAQQKYNIEDPNISSNFLVVQTYGNFDTTVYSMTDKLFTEGGYELKYLLRLAALAMYFRDEKLYMKYLYDLLG